VLWRAVQYCVVPVTAVFELPREIPHAEASILGCALFTAYGALRHAAALRPGESVAVIGAGGVGSNALQIATRVMGAGPVIAVDISDDKLRAVQRMGFASHTVNSRTENVADRIRAITNGRGVDVAIEALGHPETFRQTTDCVVDGGRAVMVGLGVAGQTGQIDINRLVRYRSPTLCPSCAALPDADHGCPRAVCCVLRCAVLSVCWCAVVPFVCWARSVQRRAPTCRQSSIWSLAK
jgi:D-arabinose 1-dehydrogenase-like Zn-dependent alcohol dehydrogenase